MRVLYVWDADYPWDVRTEKVCRALVRGGHEVVMAARNLQGRPRTEALPEGLVERLAPPPQVAGRWASFPAFFNPVWLRHLRRLVRLHSVELVMVRDLPLAPAALLAAPSRVPVVLDMAENYPAMMRDIFTDRRQRPIDYLVRNPLVVAAIERAVIRRFDYILTVVEESRDRLVALGARPERVVVVSNTPPVARVGDAPPAPADDSPLRLIYLGLMEQHRGIASTLDAAAILKAAGVRFHLDLVGDGRDYDDLRLHAQTCGLTPAEVTFHGRLPHRDAIALVAQAHVGIVPHHARESWNTTIPNKLFDYMAAGLAVLTSDARPAERIVRATGAGLVFRSGDGDHLAEQAMLCRDASVRARFGAAGQMAIRTRYNWEADSRVLLTTVERAGSRLHTAVPPRREGLHAQ